MKAIITVTIPEEKLAHILEEEGVTREQFLDQLREGVSELGGESHMPGAKVAIEFMEE